MRAFHVSRRHRQLLLIGGIFGAVVQNMIGIFQGIRWCLNRRRWMEYSMARPAVNEPCRHTVLGHELGKSEIACSAHR